MIARPGPTEAPCSSVEKSDLAILKLNTALNTTENLHRLSGVVNDLTGPEAEPGHHLHAQTRQVGLKLAGERDDDHQ